MQATRLTNVFLACNAIMLAILVFKVTATGDGPSIISTAQAQGQQRTVLYACTVTYGDCAPVPLMADKNGFLLVKVPK